jgi:NTP pyrophosphatase (non-canonical NTP hydrolase)
MIDVTHLALVLREFSAERDWDQFHTPKNLAMALPVEAAELLEVFQWLTPEQSADIKTDPVRSKRVAEELADILIYLVRLADVLGIDLNQAVADKLAANARKYPVDRARGSAAKYTERGQ